MTEIEILTWLCIIGIIVGGVMNLRHTESTLVIRQDFREKLDKEQADRYQILIGIVYIVAGVIAALFNFFADGLVYMAGLFAAVGVLVVGPGVFQPEELPRGKKKEKGPGG